MIIVLSLIILGGFVYYRIRKGGELNGTSLNNPLKVPEKGFTKDPKIKPPYPKLHKSESKTDTKNSFPEKSG